MQTLLLAIQVAANLTIVATFLVYWRQLVAMRSQLAAMQQSSRTQGLLTLIEYLQRPAVSESRGVLLGLGETDFKEWTREQRLAVERAISAYDVAGILIRDGAIPDAKAILVDNWGYSIRRCFEIAAPFVTEIRGTRGERYWDDFEWLASQVSQSGG
ncbi:MAG: hypothetical protein QOC81_4347 [Thermoanaerobaculia bacterium]|jgi:hypothetical protein|nr:hypothetical protein [Thermoanaerobaculia bacterium]